MVSELAYVDTGNRFGNMNDDEEFYKDLHTKEDIKNAFMDNRIKASKGYGFDPRYIFKANQDKKDGSYKVLDEEFIYSYSDGWDAIIPEDILIITSKTPKIVIGHPTSDYPVIVMSDLTKNVSAIGYCSPEMIDKKLPMMIADALSKEYDSRDDDIRAYVGSCIGSALSMKEYPSFAKDQELWKEAIVLGDDGLYHIDIRKVIKKELKMRSVLHQDSDYISEIDTYKHPDYYSSFASRTNIEKKGNNFEGMFYTGKQFDMPKRKVKKR